MNDIGEIGDTDVAELVPLFERFGYSDVQALVSAYPLAWVCAGSGSDIEASLLPLVGVYDESGRLTELIGHLMRSNPLFALATREPQTTILFRGPDAYVSPEYAGRRDWAPTWNYAQLRIGAEIRFDEAETEPALRVLIDAMEAKREHPWDADGIGDRYHAMLDRIIGFRARVTGIKGRFKLGQDEEPSTFDSILARLPQPDMVQWMRRFNEGR